jgi:polyketide synthase PksL
LISENTSTLNVVSYVSRLSHLEYYATDHNVDKVAVFPGAAYLEIACVVGTLAGEQKVSRLKDVMWSYPVIFNDASVEIQTFLNTIGDSTEFRITSQTASYETQLHAEGKILFEKSTMDPGKDSFNIEKIKEKCSTLLSSEEFYANFLKIGFEYKKSFQSVQNVFIGDGCCLSKLLLPNHLNADTEKYILHPALFDGVLQTVSALIVTDEIDEIFVPFAIDEIELIRPLTKNCYVYADFSQQKVSKSNKFNRYQLLVLSESGQLLVRIKNFYLRPMAKQQISIPKQAVLSL